MVALMMFAGLVVMVDNNGSDASTWQPNGSGDIYSYTLTYNSSEMANTAAQELQLTVAGATPISHSANTTTLSSLANEGSWGFDTTTGIGPFNSFYAAFDIDNGNAFVTKLNPYNLGQDLAGTALPSGNYNIMWVLPTVYWKVVDGNVTLTNDSTAGGTAYAHTINGHVYNYIAIGVYHGSTTTIDGSTTVLTSKSGVAPTASQARAVFRDQANNYTMDASLSTDATNNPAYSMLWNFYQWELYKLCCYTVMEGFNSQMIVGNGNVNGGNYTKVTGGADTLGPYAGNPGNLGASGSNAATYGQDYAKLFIEEAWGTVYDFVDGIVVNANQGFYIDTSHEPTDSTTAGGYVEYITQALPSSNFGATISTSNAKTWGFAETTDASTDYYNKGMTDKTYTASSGSKVLFVGGDSYSSASFSVYYGLSCAIAINGLTDSAINFGSRLAFVFDAGVEPPTYTASFESSNNSYGSVSPVSIADIEPGTGISISNNTLTIGETTVTATPTTNDAQYTYAFTGWSVGGTPIDSTYTIDADVTITADFTRTLNTYGVTINAGDGGSVSPASLSDILYGTTVTISGNTLSFATTPDATVVTATVSDPTAQYTYSFDKWQLNGEDVSGTATVGATNVFAAVFSAAVNEYTVTIASNDVDKGTVDVSTVSNVPYGTTVTVSGNTITIGETTITATAGATFELSGWSVSDGYVIVGDTEITANFGTPADPNQTLLNLIPLFAILLIVMSLATVGIRMYSGDYSNVVTYVLMITVAVIVVCTLLIPTIGGS